MFRILTTVYLVSPIDLYQKHSTLGPVCLCHFFIVIMRALITVRNILSREILDLIYIFDFLAYILHHAIQIIIPFEKKSDRYNDSGPFPPSWGYIE